MNFIKNISTHLFLICISINLSAHDRLISQINPRIKISNYLKTHLSKNDFKNRNLDNAYFLKFDNDVSRFIRIPFNGKPVTTDFIALQTDSLGNCSKGSIIHIVKNKLSNSYSDTIYIHNLKRDKKWIVYYQPLKKPNPADSIADRDEKVLDPVIIYGNSGKSVTCYLNVLAILNPGMIMPIKGRGFGITPAGQTSGGFGTYSWYFDINLEKNNFLPPELDKIEFERPENLPAIDIKKLLN